MAQLAGVRTTNQAITNESVRIPRFVGPEIADLEPDQAAVLTFLMKLDKRASVESPRIEWYEQDYVAKWTISAATLGAFATGTLLTVADGTLFTAGDLFLFPQAAASSTVPEIIRVVSVSTDTLTIVRGSSPQGTNWLTAIRIIGTAYEENANHPSAKTFAPVLKTSYTQIFRTSLEISATAAASKHYGAAGGERKREQAKKLVEHKIKMNGSLLFGKATESLTGGPNGNPIRTTMGLNSVITTNVSDAGGTLTKKYLEGFSETAFRYGSKEKMLLSAPKIISAIHEWGNGFLNVSPMEKVYGVNIQRVQFGHGSAMLVRDWMLENGAGSTLNGFAGWGFMLDMDSLEYKYLSGNGINRDTHLIEDDITSGQNSGRDGFVDEYLTECGFCIKVEKRHAKIFDVTDYSS